MRNELFGRMNSGLGRKGQAALLSGAAPEPLLVEGSLWWCKAEWANFLGATVFTIPAVVSPMLKV
jgi:hypothetical protein